MSDTPQTDAADDKTMRYTNRHERVLDLCRDLERRLRESHDMCDRYAEQLQAALREVEAHKRDVLRYRWLREDEETLAVFQPRKHGHIAFNGDALDAAIDAAIAEKGKP